METTRGTTNKQIAYRRCRYFSLIFFPPSTLFYSFNLSISFFFFFFFFRPFSFRPQISLPPVNGWIADVSSSFDGRAGKQRGIINNLTFIHLNLVTLIEKIQAGCGFDCSLTRGWTWFLLSVRIGGRNFPAPVLPSFVDLNGSFYADSFNHGWSTPDIRGLPPISIDGRIM